MHKARQRDKPQCGNCSVVCTGSGWDGFNLLRSSPYDAVYQIGDQNSAEITSVS